MVEPVWMVYPPTTAPVQVTTMDSIVNVSRNISFLTKGLIVVLISLIEGIPLNTESFWDEK